MKDMKGQEMFTPERRRTRAMTLTSFVQHVLEPWLERMQFMEDHWHLPISDDESRSRAARPGRDVRREVSQVLMDMFYAIGAEIITESDRIAAGLAPRDRFGLTPMELRIIEARREAATLVPPNLMEMSPPVPAGQWPKGYEPLFDAQDAQPQGNYASPNYANPDNPDEAYKKWRDSMREHDGEGENQEENAAPAKPRG